MIDRDRVYLRQMLEAIEQALGYIRGKDLSDFQSDQMLQDAVVRKIEVVGEAAKRLSASFVEQHSDLPLIEAISIRNKLIHEYDDIDPKIVWDTVKEDLPKLAKAARKLID